MRHKKLAIVIISMIVIVALIQCSKTFENTDSNTGTLEEKQAAEKNKSLVAQGKEIFRFDDFGDTAFWGGVLHIDKAILGINNGGYGSGVSPRNALAIGLKVNAEALPADVVAGIQSGAISLNDPLTTVALLKLNAVVGIKGYLSQAGTLQSIGITCAVCHSTVDNSFSFGI